MQDWESGANISEVPVVLFFKAVTVNLDHPEHGGCKAIRNVSTYVSTYTSRGRAISQSVSCRYLAADDQVLSQSSSYGICGKRSSTRTRLFQYSHFR